MFCSECGKPVAAAAKFCGECGAKVDLEEGAPLPHPQVPPQKPPLSAPGAIFSSTTTSSVAPAKAAEGRSGSALAGRSLSIVGGLLTLLALLLPWFQVSCGGVRVEIEGYRLLAGTTAEKVRPLTGQIGQMGGMLAAQNPQGAAAPRAERPNMVIIMWLALILLAAQLASSRKLAGGGALGAAALSGVLLIYFYASTNSEVQGLAGQSMGMVQFQWVAGFWIAAAGTILVGIGAALRLADSS